MVAMALRYQREQVTTESIAEAMNLLRRNHAETGYLPNSELTVDDAGYVALEAAGLLRYFTARTEEGELAGYTVLFVRRHPHQMQALQATQDTLYVAPEHRQGLAGLELINFADAALAAEGVVAVYRQSTARRDISMVLWRLGYEQIENVFARKLSHGN